MYISAKLSNNVFQTCGSQKMSTNGRIDQRTEVVDEVVGVGGEELLPTLVAVGDSTGVASCRGTHLEVVYGVAYHKGVSGFQFHFTEYFEGQIGCGFGAKGFILAIYIFYRDVLYDAETLYEGVERHVVPRGDDGHADTFVVQQCERFEYGGKERDVVEGQGREYFTVDGSGLVDAAFGCGGGKTETVGQWQPDGLGHFCRVGLGKPHTFQCPLHSADDAFAGVAQSAVEIKEDVLVSHTPHNAISARKLLTEDEKKSMGGFFSVSLQTEKTNHDSQITIHHLWTQTLFSSIL